MIYWFSQIKGGVSIPSGLDTQVIPEGKYEKFVVHGDVQQAVVAFWTKLWSMNLDRKYSCDFEEYQSGCEMHNAEIHIYISVKQSVNSTIWCRKILT
jgi:predicted transcriptional regulator YdeE